MCGVEVLINVGRAAWRAVGIQRDGGGVGEGRADTEDMRERGGCVGGVIMSLAMRISFVIWYS